MSYDDQRGEEYEAAKYGPHDDPCDCDVCKYAAQGAWGRRNAPTNQPVPLESGADAPTHLPGCFMGDPVTIDRPGLCICDRLRACEARMLDSAPQFVKANMEGKQVGFFLGVQAAREAVAAVRGAYGGQPLIERADALNAIDALKEQP